MAIFPRLISAKRHLISTVMNLISSTNSCTVFHITSISNDNFHGYRQVRLAISGFPERYHHPHIRITDHSPRPVNIRFNRSTLLWSCRFSSGNLDHVLHFSLRQPVWKLTQPTFPAVLKQLCSLLGWFEEPAKQLFLYNWIVFVFRLLIRWRFAHKSRTHNDKETLNG